MGALRAAAAAAALAFVGGVQAAELKIVDIKAYAFLERADKLSDDLISGGETLVDAPKGGALGGTRRPGCCWTSPSKATRTLPPNTRPRSST